MSETEELIPRTYQEKLIRIAVKQNSIIYLPTGSGKTFIAVCVLKELGIHAFEKPYSQYGKITIMVVNSVVLVQQHANYIRQNTSYEVGGYSGDMNVDFWDGQKWLSEFEKHQVLVMTAQILNNILSSGFCDINRLNLLIFDECHQAVDNHPMRQIMGKFQSASEPPQVLGLTATLLNGNIKETQVLNEVENLETTFQSKVATVDELEHVIGYSTNPKEKIALYDSYQDNEVIEKACSTIEEMIVKVKNLKPVVKNIWQNKLDHPYFDKPKAYEPIYKALMDAVIHLRMLGVSGGQIAIICYIIHFQCETVVCKEKNTLMILHYVIALFCNIKTDLDNYMASTPAHLRLLKFSSPKVLKLISILAQYETESTLDLCGIVFVQRKTTARFIYHIFKELTKTFQNKKFVNADFIVGFNANPMKVTRQQLYFAKMNKNIIKNFRAKQINVIIASNVLEEGIDIPTCSLIVKFDTPTNYREYIQSKGRARHKSSLYYIMVDQSESAKFCSNYNKYRNIEDQLSGFLIGYNEMRKGPNDDDIDEMYRENEFYYVNGHGSAHISMLSAIQTLMMYCSSLQSDCYTLYEPTWYLEQGNNKFRVIIELPVVCPLVDPIYGDFCASKKDAKRSAAFRACILLHKCGELNDQLIPGIKEDVINAHCNLFLHWPEESEKDAGLTKKVRVYEKKTPNEFSSVIKTNHKLYLHIININPVYNCRILEENVLNQIYGDNLSFGFLTAEPLPLLCKFPLYVSQGELDTEIVVNAKEMVINETDIQLIRHFHHLVFFDVIEIVKPFLYMGSEASQHMLIVPVMKNDQSIAFDVMKKHERIIDQDVELKAEEKHALVVNEHTYEKKIVTPWYRREGKQYIVLNVSSDENAKSPFPSDNYKTYAHYFMDKYALQTINPSLPLLVVKAISSRLNCMKPRGISKKKNRAELYDCELRLIPEMCVKQEFPSSLWMQAKLLPTIFHRFMHLLRCEKFRRTIVEESYLGRTIVENWEPLEKDPFLIDYETEKSPSQEKVQEMPSEPNESNLEIQSSIMLRDLNRDFENKMTDAIFPWDAAEEPKDIDRSLDATMFDVKYFMKFINAPVAANAHEAILSKSQTINNKRLMVTYKSTFKHRDISFLNVKDNPKGPELRTIYQALTTSKANDLVNLERLETLGDSFLKLVASLYIFLKYPTYSEGRATDLKGRLVSNKNLFYLAKLKGIGNTMKAADFAPNTEWLPPNYCIPELVVKYIEQNKMSISNLYHLYVPREQVVKGQLESDFIDIVMKELEESDDNAEEDDHKNVYSSLNSYLEKQTISDKTMADVAEALIGAYFKSNGCKGGLIFMEWLGLFPKSENITNLFQTPIPNPVINKNASQDDIDFLLPKSLALKIEKILDYSFKNKAFLLQALTHSSYTNNRVTLSYERLEFVGDAVLDFLITSHIYELCEGLTPGELTDLRSALVNNEIFAAYVVKLGFHNYLKHFNSQLQENVNKFVMRQEAKDFAINDDVLILINEKDLKIAENVEVPKVLGDLFESIAGAIFLDCGMDMRVVWRVYYRLMHEEINAFSKDVPKNSIRLLHEYLSPLTPSFGKSIDVSNNELMVKLDFMLDGTLTRVHGFGNNRKTAKKAAAKVALTLLQKSKGSN